MSRIEELPDDFCESLNLNEPANARSIPPKIFPAETPFPIKEDGLEKEPSTSPAMPPGMASVKSHTTEEIFDMMNRTPLFMTELSKATDAGTLRSFKNPCSRPTL